MNGNSQSIAIQPVFGQNEFKLNDKWFKLNDEDSINFSSLKFYISKVEILNKNQIIWQEKDSYHLLNIEEEKSLRWDLKLPAGIIYDQISFNLGIDSVTNVSGAMGGDLDPTKGMYWTWQSGYVNFRMEGKCSSIKSRKKDFHFHIGGYQFPCNAVQKIILDVNNSASLKIQMDLKRWLEQIDLSQQNNIMTPDAEAFKLATKLKTIFSVQPE